MDAIATFYAANLRSGLFTGFMTFTGFLFTLHTFLLVTLHRDIYGREDYQKWAMQLGHYNPSLRPIGPLRNISRLLLAVLCCAFITSISQFSIGLIKSGLAACFCLGLAVLTSALFLVTLVVFGCVISDWLRFVERDAKKVEANNSAGNQQQSTQ
jgi:hypothetical protein